MNYRTHYSTRITPQSEPIPGTTKNDAGGYAFPVDDWTRLDRFLILGAEGGSYYVAERELTRANAEAVARCISADPQRVVTRIVDISHTGRAPKNDPALFALAMAIADKGAQESAAQALPLVARTGTHLLHFIHYVEGFRGWGRDLRQAVAAWYNGQTPADLAYQAIKYQSRDGWAQRDVLRLAHVKPANDEQSAVYKWIVKGEAGESAPTIIHAFEAAKRATDAKAVAGLVRAHKLPREAVPTQWLNDVGVWEALLEDMPLTAMVRNLGKMTSIGLLAPFSEGAKHVLLHLNSARIQHSRIHPLALLLALKTYATGHGDKGSLTWEPVGSITDALDEAFYLAFQNVEPTGKRLLLALDVSGSMGWSAISGTSITAREGSAAMALLTAKTERDYHTMAFCDDFVPLNITPRQRLDDAVRAMSSMSSGGTDCALPMLWALKNKVTVDAFVIYTDSETWAGYVHPAQALAQYRQQINPRAKLIVVGMTSEGFSIADPNDAGQMDVVGFDAAAPVVMGDFIR